MYILDQVFFPILQESAPLLEGCDGLICCACWENITRHFTNDLPIRLLDSNFSCAFLCLLERQSVDKSLGQSIIPKVGRFWKTLSCFDFDY